MDTPLVAPDPAPDPAPDQGSPPRGHVLRVWAPDGLGEVGPEGGLDALGADIAPLLPDLRTGDVVLVTSKVVAKAEGRERRGAREDAVARETVRVVARRGPTRIVENRQGLVMAAAGVDASNVRRGRVVLLPRDPDASARALRELLLRLTRANVAVVVTDTAGRAWRTGQVDIAVGAAGLLALEDLTGQVDGFGNPLQVTAPAVADELAGAAELAQGKLSGRPVAVVRGLGDRVLAPGEHGPGARALQRPRSLDMFALGAREAVLAAVSGRHADCFGAPAPVAEVTEALQALAAAGCSVLPGEPGDGTAPRDGEPDSVDVQVPADVAAGSRAALTVELVAFAHGWTAGPGATPGVLVLRPTAGGPPRPDAP